MPGDKPHVLVEGALEIPANRWIVRTGDDPERQPQWMEGTRRVADDHPVNDGVPSPAFEELWSGYQSLANVIVGRFKDRSYEMGYLDAWADAMAHVDWALEGKPVQGKQIFELLLNKKIRRRARREMVTQRAAGKKQAG